MRTFLFLFSLLFLSGTISAQFATRKITKREQAYTDSLKQVNYDYVFPFLGQQTYKAGFDIAYPVGIMANYVWMNQSLLLNNMELGLVSDNLDIPLTNVDEFIKFGDNSNTSYTVNVRPDIWVFPFLNVYGLFGVGQSETTVNITSPVELTSVVKQQIRTAGVGIMGAFGLGPLWLSLDGNWTWNKPDLLDKPVNVAVFGIRLGHTFTFEQHPDRNIAVWAGGMRLKMESNTVGQIKIIDALPPETWDNRDQLVADYRAWYEAQPPFVQDQIDQTPIPDIVDRIEQADGEAIIKYAMDKQVVQEWSGVLGHNFSTTSGGCCVPNGD